MKVVWLHPPMYTVNHQFLNILADYVDLIVYQYGDHPNFKIDAFSERKYSLRIINRFTYHHRKQNSLLMIKYLLSDKPDIVVSVAFWMPSLYAALAKVFLGFKFIITTDATVATEKSIGKIKKIIRGFVGSRSKIFIAASKLTEAYLKKEHKCANIYVSRHTIDTKQWIYDIDGLPKKNELRKQKNIPIDKLVLLGVGSFQRIKNWISVIKQLDKIQNIYFVLIGNGSLKEEYMSFIESKKLEDKVLLLTWKSQLELQKYYKLSDIFIFPTMKDTFGFVVPEAMSAGLPVLCSKYAGASELIEDGINGFIFDPGKDFSNIIEKTIEDRFALSQNAKKAAYQNTLQKRVLEHFEIFSHVMSETNK
ncbi:glycosyltransferase [Francisellaceae bacterium]|nr:glycosyltransferase [Francisellaceae bacterium]